MQQIRLNPFSWVLELREFSLPAGDGQLLAGFEALRIDLAAWESIKLGGVVVDSIELSKLQLNIARRADGRFNFADLQPEQTEAEAVPAAPEADTDPVKLLIRHAAISDGKLAWLDVSTGQALAETLVPINLMLQDISTQAEQAGNGKLTLGIESGGSIEWSGDFSLQPLASKGHLQLDAIGLDKVWQLFLQQLPIRIAAGRAGLRIDYDLTSADSGVAVLLNNGALALQQLAVVEKTAANH